MTSYKVGTVEGMRFGFQKFIVQKKSDDLIFHTAERDRRGYAIMMCKQLADSLFIPRGEVVGGGIICTPCRETEEYLSYASYWMDQCGTTERDICLMADSVTFGGIPLEVARKYSEILLPAFKKFRPDLQRITVADFGGLIRITDDERVTPLLEEWSKRHGLTK
jgi:hypothetical protein